MQREEELYSYLITSSPLQLVLRKLEESKISIMQLPLRAFTPSKVSLLRLVKEYLPLKVTTRRNLRLILIGSILLVALIIVQKRSIFRSSLSTGTVQNVVRFTNTSTKILRAQVSQKTLSAYRYIISLVYNLVNKFQWTLPNAHREPREVASMQNLMRTRVERVLGMYEMRQEKPPVRLNVEEDMYIQVEAVFDLLEALLKQKSGQSKNDSNSYSLKTSPRRLSTKEHKSVKPLESNNYNIQTDKENSPSNAYEKLNNAIFLTERLARDLEFQ